LGDSGRLIPRWAGRPPDWWKITERWRMEETPGFVPVPYVTMSLIITCAFVFSYELARSRSELSRLFRKWGLVPANLVDWLESPDVSRAPVTVFSSAFLHGDVVHFALNVAILCFFGIALERLLVRSFDNTGYLIFVLICVFSLLGATALQVGLTTDDTIPIVGASGVIAGIAGAYLMTNPRPIWAMIIIVWFVLQAYSGIATLGVDTRVAYYAHIGGFVTGCACMLLLSALVLRARGA
jgi:membrane associated rhomboid family serine protease